MTIDQAMQVGLRHHHAGRLAEAEGIYRQVLAVVPHHVGAWLNLGVMAAQLGQREKAVELLRHAAACAPDCAEAYYNLGLVLRAQGKLDEVIGAYRRVVELRPESAEALTNLGVALCDGGELEEAVAVCRRAMELRPDVAEIHYNLARTLGQRGDFDGAIAGYRRALELKPGYVEAQSNLAADLCDAGRIDEAIAAARRSVALKAEHAPAHSVLGTALTLAGRHDEGMAAWREAVQLRPDDAAIGSNLVFYTQFQPNCDGAALRREQRSWNDRHGVPLRGQRRGHGNDRAADRKLRIGYVSPDFRDHVVGRNVLPLLANHDREGFEVFAYCNTARGDALTERFRGLVDGWREIATLGDEEVAEQIRRDGIDILVDLALHTAGNRLLVFARKPAPVQVSFAGYPGSTGLEAMDYRLTDGYLEPEEESAESPSPQPSPGVPGEGGRGERAVRLPHSFWCYDPLDCGDIAAGPLPAQTNGYVTFGCLNNFMKVNGRVLRGWAEVLKRVTGSRLVLLAEEGEHRQRTMAMLSALGIDPGRVEFVGRRPRRLYLELYNGIDVGLDTYPYNGHTTSLDSYWMGVPVVTLVGDMVVSRAGFSQLSNLGLTELAAFMPERFVEIAVELAKDLPRLAELRRTLRGRMEASPLMDAAGFTRGIEAAYRGMWKAWCRA